MEDLKLFDTEGIVRGEVGNMALRGFFKDAAGQVWFDRRPSFDAIMRGQILRPRISGLNVVGPDFVAVPEELATELGYNGA